ncbi:MAG: helix-hairpin-helix domain-containing protein [Chloroflexi bacterium]|nr:helix-hairpin-helix domain-containing protein [Chloroflexota bacterium]MCI0579214.1 helix-hairpin-helix domain-containing protein [Chloroflexota bacterium]MCI0648273.1 helix-hairpin-helix domain-containing protein [Chloroflexota bacterium]MCI0728465.1 helix-hairpin-helix domain-containing protein [Chloroflexota bacterium]
MDTVGVLAFVVGLLAGIFLAMVIDGYTMGRRVQTAVSEKNLVQNKVQRLMMELRDLEIKLAARQMMVQSLSQELVEKTRQVGQQSAEKQELQLNLNRVGNELEASQAENQQLCQRLAVADVEMKHRQQELEAAQKWLERADRLQSEKEALLARVNQAETQAADLNGLLRQLTETHSLRQQLLAAEEKLKTAGVETNSLQTKVINLQKQLDYTGKNRLEIIRGIGPAYARRLNEAGVDTLADLAQMTPDQVAKIIKPKNWQAVEPAAWIAEAKILAGVFDGQGGSSQ